MPDPAPDLMPFLQKEFARLAAEFQPFSPNGYDSVSPEDFIQFKPGQILDLGTRNPSVSAEIEIVSIRVPRGREKYWKKRIEEAFDLLDELDEELADELRTEWR